MLRFIFGRSGYGKTEYCFSNIENLIKNGEDNILLITPEQFNFTAERRLLKALGEQNINKVENSSFSRLYNEVTRLYGGSNLPVLSKGAKAVLMKKAIDSVSENLLVFNKKTNTSSFVTSMVKIYDEMKSCNISFEDMDSVSNVVDKEILSLKLKDMSKIISTYQYLIDGVYFDSADEITKLYEKLLETNYISGKKVFIDGFNGFLASEFKVIELIIKQADCVTITLSTDSYLNDDKYSIFSYVNKNARKLEKIAKDNNIPVEVITLEKNFRTVDNNLLLAEKNLYERTTVRVDDIPNSLQIYSAKSITDECNFVSLMIKKQLRSGTKAKDIAVICRDLDKYSNELSYSFKKYEIPFFDDERQPINMQPLVVFVQYLLRTVIYSFRSDDVLSLAKTGLTNLDQKNISLIENYIYLWNINGVKKWSKPFESSTKGFSSELNENDKHKLDSINKSRELLFSKINRFKNSVKDATSLEISRSIYNALIDFNVNKHIKDIAKSLSNIGKDILAEEQGRIWDLLMQILNQLAVIGGDEKIPLSEYYTYFNIMISSEDLGVLPQGLDNVQFGQADRIRTDNPKVVFVLGANEGEFPRAVTSGGLLSENDRIILSNNEFELYSFGETLNIQERYFAYMATSAPQEKLYVSYLGNCNNFSPSVIVSSLKELFPNIKEIKYSDIPEIELIESKASAFELMAEGFNKNTEFYESLKEYFRNDERFNSVKLLAENEEVYIKDKSLSTSLFGEDMYLSASRLEDFFNCRFRYFCKFGLMARPRKKAEMDAMNTGIVIHYVLEKIIGDIGSPKLSKMSKTEIYILVDKYLRDYLTNEMGNYNDFTTRFKYQFMRLSKMLNSVVCRLADEFSQSEFEAKAFELSIDKDGEVEPSVINLENGTVSIRGDVDRVDILVENGKKYIRVVDYKSGNKKFKLSDILYGLNLQMFVYLFTICNDKNSKYYGIPAGVLYMHAARSIFNLQRDNKESELSKKENDEFKMKGLVLYDSDHDILKSMEKDLQGKYVPVKMTKKGDVSGCFASLEELGKISKKIENLVAEMGNLLHDGCINQNPINGKDHDKTCEFCDYSSVCANKRFIKTRDMDEISDSDVLETLKEE